MTNPDFATHPYLNLEDRAFWSRSIALGKHMVFPDLFRPKFEIKSEDRIATAGSCFAQHLGRNLVRMAVNLLDLEPAPPGLSLEQSKAHGYGLYSARYGNIYTTRQFRRLVEEAIGEIAVDTQAICWEREGRWYDALRPQVEPQGWDSPAEIAWHRVYHLERVRQLLQDMDVLVYTMGLTEAWTSADGILAFPIAPGVVAGRFDSACHRFRCLSQAEVTEDFRSTLDLMRRWREGRPFRVLLTVSPVPLAATFSGAHVLTATMASKATLVSAAAELAQSDQAIDYFPSFEILTNPWLGIQTFEQDQRSVTPEAVEQVMRVWAQSFGFTLQPPAEPQSQDRSAFQAQSEYCEELLTDVFARCT